MRSLEAVERHDGHIAQYLGDGVLVYFGYPRAHEDDAKRAVRCGIDILSGMQPLNHDAATTQSAGLQVRIGVHTGRVVVGSVGSGLRREQLAQGDTPNIAARLQNLAAPDTLLVSDTTWGLVKAAFYGEDVGERELKGISEPIRLWRVTHSKLGEALASSSATTRYIGRTQQHRALETEWTNAFVGAAGFCHGAWRTGHRKIAPRQRVSPWACRQGGRHSHHALHQLYEQQRLAASHRPHRAAPGSGARPATRGKARPHIDARLAELGISASDSAPLLATLLSIPADASGQADPTLPASAGLVLDEDRQLVTLPSGAELELTGTEFRLLRYFMRNPNKVLSKHRLLEHIYDQQTEHGSNLIEVYVRRLREKIGRERVRTQRGQGYVFPSDP